MLKPVSNIAIGNNSGLMEAYRKDKDDSLEFWYVCCRPFLPRESVANQPAIATIRRRIIG
jgi:hypothetical protein